MAGATAAESSGLSPGWSSEWSAGLVSAVWAKGKGIAQAAVRALRRRTIEGTFMVEGAVEGGM